MEQMINNILAIIPARGGSKGLLRKNIIDTAGKPLISWTIEASLKSKYVTKTIVSSDDDEILSISESLGAEVIKRPGELATDESSSEVVIEHALKELCIDGSIKFEFIILLQPTSPLRDSEDIDLAFKKLFSMDATALISVFEINNKILKAFKVNQNGCLEGVGNNKYPFMRRQELPKTYMPNGAIYIIKGNEFEKTKALFTDKTTFFEMSEIKSLDIDDKKDLEKAVRYLK
jgi:CMP-N-acetylneuraminic acid synthetase